MSRPQPARPAPEPPLLECVPNLSEGRRPEVIRALEEAVTSRPGVTLLDLSSDPDHDRTVLTLCGAPEPLHRALLELYRVALEAIDLSASPGPATPPGVHPRIGAVDVVPFVPLGSTPLAVAVDAAHRLGAEVARRFDLPVHLYEEAARSRHRRALPHLRRGGFEGLARSLGHPDGAPDYGPARPHPTAGATVIGARPFLIAFNAVLDGAPLGRSLEIARDIARTVRESGGGLPGLRAIGVPLASRGRAQVSMNLVDFRRTSPLAALLAVERQALAHGVRVAECELVGLMPEEAAMASLRDALRLPDSFGADRILEWRLERSAR